MQAVYQGNATYAPSVRPQNDGWKPPPVFMLVMGLSGCGKSSFINLMTQGDCLISTGPKLCTRFPRTCKISRWVKNSEFKFIDTPGFANDTVEDRKVLERLVEYLAPRGDRHDGSNNLPRRVTGLLYIHSEDEPFKSRTSRKTIEMLVKVLGERFLERVTVLIQSQNGASNDLAEVVQSESSPLYPLYCNNIKPWTIPYTQNPQSIEHMLESYTTIYPRLVRLAALDNFAQREGNNWQYNDIPRHLWEFFPHDVGPLIIPDQANAQTRLSGREDELEKALAQKAEEIKALISTHEIELKDIQEKSMAEKADHDIQRGGLCNTIRDQKAEVTELQSRISSGLQESEALKELNSKKDSEILVLQGELATKNDELMKVKEDNDRAIQELKGRLRDKESEVVELKSRTNGPTNGPTTKTTKKQEDEIHHLKAEIHRISAEYGSLRSHMQLQENTEQADIMKALGDVNRLVEEFGQTISEHIETHMEHNKSKKPFQPKDLLNMFGQVEGDLASKIKQDAYLLLEYAVQAVMCDQLYTHLFKPFHPSISDDRNVFVSQIHAELARKAPQSVSGRWRKDAFNSISRCLALEGHDKSDSERMHRLLTGALVALLEKFDGIKPEEVLKKHDKALVKLVTKAEELNELIKGGVSVLGDFQPVAFPFGRAFQSSHMSEVTSKPKKPVRPETILGTVGLGLVKSYASGGDRVPGETVLNVAKVFGSPK
ncbi:50S ribosome-binding GTPase [Rhizoctonia solani 123E]|uniref:50S ribosome-binding GTPase n=1 Tax=Rhizoctonia solani 123E TaxID=1423351 RepID=A0A074S8Q9_9AGAM|nr:50S ribosome-binding GTPase [Rhizoctonia solani 123E]